MAWLIVAIGSYILLAITSLIDKILLSGQLSNPKIYAFYVGILSSAAFLLLPFGFWSNPPMGIFLIGMAAGASQIYGSYFYLAALGRMEASRVVPVIGGLVPMFGFFLTVLVSKGQAVLSLRELTGFILLIAGSWLIVARGVSIKNSGLYYVFPASFLFALSVILSKLVYLELQFIEGFILLAFGSVFAALTFLISVQTRKMVFGHQQSGSGVRPGVLFFFGQVLGGAAFLLQSFSVSLAPQASVPVINAMAGIQYVFLFFFLMVVSFLFPKKIKEATDKISIIQKVMAITLIMIGLAIFALV